MKKIYRSLFALTLIMTTASHAQSLDCSIAQTEINENFNAQPTGTQFNPSLPECWSILKSSTENVPYIYVSGSGEDKYINMYNMLDTEGHLILVSPKTDNLGNGTKRLRFKYIADEGAEIKIVSLPTNTSTEGMEVIDTIVLTEDVWDMTEYTVDLPTGTNPYFGIAHGMSGTFQFIEIDDIIYEETTEDSENPAITGVSISFLGNASNTISEIGGTVSLTATVNPQSANQDVIWSIQPESVGTIDANGVVTAVSDGIATVTATSVSDSNKFDQKAIIVDSTENEYCTPKPIQFQINAPTSPITLVQFGQNGINGIDKSSPSEVSIATPKYENFSNITMDVQKGQTYTLKVEGAIGNPLDGSESFDEYVVVYIDWNNDGVFSNSLSGGEKYQEDVPEMNSETPVVNYNITIPSNTTLGTKRMRIVKSHQMPSSDPCNPTFLFGQVEDYSINVIESDVIEVTEIEVSTATPNASTTLTAVGQELQLIATITPSSEENDITWTITPEGVVTVSENGLVTAVANGTATITATLDSDNQINDTILITVEIDTTPEPEVCEAVSTIDENFNDFTTFPENCWSSNAESPSVSIAEAETTEDKVVQLYSGSDPQIPIYIITPELIQIESNKALSLDVISISQPGSTLEIGTLTDPEDMSTFVAIQEPMDTQTGTIISNALPVSETSKYIAIKFNPNGMHKALKLDNIRLVNALSSESFDVNKVSIYPNPSKGIYNIHSDLNITNVEVYNALGQRVVSGNSNVIDIQGHASGIYFVKVFIDNNLTNTYKVIKE